MEFCFHARMSLDLDAGVGLLVLTLARVRCSALLQDFYCLFEALQSDTCLFVLTAQSLDLSTEVFICVVSQNRVTDSFPLNLKLSAATVLHFTVVA
jgi:hypothetical protein